MANTPSYTQGVKYIKVSKKDANGNNQTNELQNLNDIRVLFGDIISPVDYFIASVNEYPSYYLYIIAPTNVTSSVDNEILNYKVSASSNTLDFSTGNVISYSVVSNPTNYFTASSGYWTLGNTPNISPLNVTCSISFSVTPPGFISGSSFAGGAILASLNLHQIINGVDTKINSSTVGISLNPYPGATAGPYTLSLNSSLYPIENSSYYLSFTPDVYTFTNMCYIYSVNNSQFQVTQSIAPYTSPGNNLTVLEPYIDGQFEGSDANVLQNNAIINQLNPLYMAVDYNNSSIIAENQAAILNGSATRAQVQPWNYTYASQISGRYIGREQKAIAYNTYTSASQFATSSAFGFSGSWPGDTTSPSVNGSVVIEQLDSCIYEINWGGGGYPENSNGGGFSLNNILLVGSNKDDVTVISPDNPLYYDTITKNLPYLSQLLVRQYNPTSNSALTVTSLYPGISINDAVYWIPSDYSENSAYTGYFYPMGSGSIVNQPLIQLYSTGSGGNHNFIPYGTRINGVQQIGRPYYPMDQAMITISSSLSPSNPWFASLYYGSGNIGSSGSIPGLGEIASGSSTYQMGYPFEITSIQYDPTVIGPSSQSKAWNIFIKNTNPNLFTNLFQINPIGTNGATSVYQLGLILTNGNNPNTFIGAYIPSPQGAWNRFSGIGTGYITTQYPTETIQQNINYITKKYGNNPNP